MDRAVEGTLQAHVILDNLATHKAPGVKRWLLRHPRFHLHFTPTYASWLNLVERFFALLTEEALRRASHTSIPQLRDAILEYVNVHNNEAKIFLSGPGPPTRFSTSSATSASAPSQCTGAQDHFGRKP